MSNYLITIHALNLYTFLIHKLYFKPVVIKNRNAYTRGRGGRTRSSTYAFKSNPCKIYIYTLTRKHVQKDSRSVANENAKETSN